MARISHTIAQSQPVNAPMLPFAIPLSPVTETHELATNDDHALNILELPFPLQPVEHTLAVVVVQVPLPVVPLNVNGPAEPNPLLQSLFGLLSLVEEP